MSAAGGGAAAAAAGAGAGVRIFSTTAQPTVTVHNENEVLPRLNEKQFQPAEFNDLVANKQIYVRNKRAVITSVDFPLVYFRYETETVVKHRSFTVDPHLFAVDISSRAKGSDDLRHNPAYASDDDEPAAPPLPAAMPPPPSAAADAAAATSDATAAAAAAPAAEPKTGDAKADDPLAAAQRGAKNALLNGFLMRTPKYIVKSVDGKEQSVDAKHPQSVHIENSANSQFTLLHKVNTLTLIKCHAVTATVPAVISSIELISCTGVTIAITDSADTVTMDDGCKDCDVVLSPALRERLRLVITHDCSAIRLTVRDPPTVAPLPGATAAATSTYAVPAPAAVAAVVAAPAAAAAADAKAADAKAADAAATGAADQPASPVQYVTRWNDPAKAAGAGAGDKVSAPTAEAAAAVAPAGAAAGWVTEKLQRKGIGLITNL